MVLLSPRPGLGGRTSQKDFPLTHPTPREVTRLPAGWGGGDEAALAELPPLVEKGLRRLAHHYMSRGRDRRTLQTTALINEAYPRLAHGKQAHFQRRAHFFAVASNPTRQIMVDHARARAEPRKGRVVELRCFGGLSAVETARVLKVHPNSVLNDWREAGAWLYCVLGGEGAS